jgi:hypothetical protein
VLNKLNKKYNYGVEFFMLAIDEGIKGYIYAPNILKSNVFIETIHLKQ